MLLAGPILWLGTVFQRRVTLLGRFSIPPAVVGGFAFSCAVLVVNLSGIAHVTTELKVSHPAWNWLVTAPAEWREGTAKAVHLPFLVGFFTCVGLNATWLVVRRGSALLVVFLAVIVGLILAQNLIGISLALLLGQDALLGLVCGSVTLAGGHGTALGFADTLQTAGLAAAGTTGAAAATFGLVAGSLIGGPVAIRLLQRHRLREIALPVTAERREFNLGFVAAPAPLTTRAFLLHLVALAALIKLGASLSEQFRAAGIVLPVYMGAMLLGAALRNLVDLSPWRVIDTEIVDRIGRVLLGIFLAVAMSGLNLVELAATAVPMLVILFVQVAFVAWFAIAICFRFAGRDYNAAVMSAGLCGFGLGATPNAVANMDAVAARFGPSPQAFVIVPTVGGMLMDFPNAFVITSLINVLS